ncbi:MAG: MFS transporter [Alphaproteobacteria bacterium]|nr:MFS transporter [Alphaproteobacteria bacterium]
MSVAALSRARLFQPGPVALASLFGLETMARAVISVIVPVEALRVLGDARDVSATFAATTCAVLVLSQAVPLLIRGIGPGWTYVIAALMGMLMPLCLAASSVVGVAAAILLRGLSLSLAGNALQILILSHIERRDLARMEPLRVVAAAGSWSILPTVGIVLFTQVSDWAAYGLSIVASLILLLHLALLRPSVPAARWATSGRAAFAPLRTLKRFVAQPRLRLAYVLNLARENWWSMFFVYVPIYAVSSGLGATEGGYIVSAGSALLFVVPIFGRLARRIGMRRLIVTGFTLCGAAVIGAAALVNWPLGFVGLILASAVATVALDSVCMVTFQRAVRARERPEMTTVFTTYRDVAALISTSVFSLLLTFLGLWSVFAATGLWLIYCAWLGRHVPRGM